MPVVTEDATLRIDGIATVEEAEALVSGLEAALAAGGPAALDLAGASHLHAAVLQVLLAYRPAIVAPAAPELAAALAAAGLLPDARRDAA